MQVLFDLVNVVQASSYFTLAVPAPDRTAKPNIYEGSSNNKASAVVAPCTVDLFAGNASPYRLQYCRGPKVSRGFLLQAVSPGNSR